MPASQNQSQSISKSVGMQRSHPHYRINSRLYHIQGGDHIFGFDGDGRNRKIGRTVFAVGQEGVPVLEEAHGPSIFLPGEQGTPVLPVTTAEEADETICIHGTRFDHRGEKNIATHAAAVYERTGDGSKLR